MARAGKGGKGKPAAVTKLEIPVSIFILAQDGQGAKGWPTAGPGAEWGGLGDGAMVWVAPACAPLKETAHCDRNGFAVPVFNALCLCP